MKITLLLALVIGLGIGYVINIHATEKAAFEVYTTCNESRMSDTINETKCGDLQDKYGIEFLCEQRNNLSTNTCWTEAK
jgi:hypothetical protein